jgi:Mycoplasma protein of unknown function, DUF285
MSSMFKWADMFNQDVSFWNVSSVNNLSYMFQSAVLFNQDMDRGMCLVLRT